MATKGEELEKAARGEGCLGRARDDEHVFILRAKDKLAAKTVIYWCMTALDAGVPSAKIAEALRSAADMLDYRATFGCHTPD